MTGIVYAVNRGKGTVSVAMSANNFTVFEVYDSFDFEIGDTLSGELKTRRSQTLRNVTKEQDINAYILQVNCTRERALELLENPKPDLE